MSNEPRQPRPDDAVLGGQSPPPLNAAVLGGLEGLKRRFASSSEEEKFAVLRDAFKYGAQGLQFLEQVLTSKMAPLQKAAYTVLWENSSDREREKLREYLFKFEFETVTVDASGLEINRIRREAEYCIEDLGNGTMLEMVSIPEGTFIMGSPANERNPFKFESPQHPVSIAAFFMGKYPVTQAQWRAVAALPRVKLSLNPDPSYFKGDTLPVKNVSWHEAVEFCDRLSQKTGCAYRLPSEAKWEYACRAGTTTPFYCGETITSDLANYNGDYPYANAPTGTNRQQSTPTGSFLPNAFGLYDMHGNVCEWCADPWHDNYNGAPSDGSVWQSGGNKDYRVLRGGSWYLNAIDCRCASRNWLSPGFRNSSCGFRVAVALLLPAS